MSRCSGVIVSHSFTDFIKSSPHILSQNSAEFFLRSIESSVSVDALMALVFQQNFIQYMHKSCPMSHSVKTFSDGTPPLAITTYQKIARSLALRSDLNKPHLCSSPIHFEIFTENCLPVSSVLTLTD